MNGFTKGLRAGHFQREGGTLPWGAGSFNKAGFRNKGGGRNYQGGVDFLYLNIQGRG